MSKQDLITKNLVRFAKNHKKFKRIVLLCVVILCFFSNLFDAFKRHTILYRLRKLALLCIAFFIILLSIRYANVSITAEPEPKAPLGSPKFASSSSAKNTQVTKVTVNSSEPYTIHTDGSYMIHTAEGLYQFAALVNTGQFTLNASLTNDIDLSEYSNWIPIADFSSNKDFYYSGTFDGCGYTISGLTFSNPAKEYRALFGFLKKGTVKNLSLSNSKLSGSRYLAGISVINQGTISNCSSEIQILSDKESIFLGGICSINYGSILFCNSTATIVGGTYLGGLAGGNYGQIRKCSSATTITGDIALGGIAGLNEQGTIQNCHTSQSAKIKGNMGIGGICGVNTETSIIKTSDSISIVSGKVAASSIIGINYGSIFDCFTYLEQEKIYDVIEISGYNYGMIDSESFQDGS